MCYSKTRSLLYHCIVLETLLRKSISGMFFVCLFFWGHVWSVRLILGKDLTNEDLQEDDHKVSLGSLSHSQGSNIQENPVLFQEDPNSESFYSRINPVLLYHGLTP